MALSERERSNIDVGAAQVTSACFCETSGVVDSLSNLSSPSSPLRHTLVAAPGDVDGYSRTDENGDLVIAVEDRKRLEQHLSRKRGGRVYPVFIPDEVDKNETFTLGDQEKWTRYAEQELFPLLQDKQRTSSDEEATKKAWADFFHLNQKFAEAIMNVYKPGDIVIVHDFLFLVPSILRQMMPSMYVGFVMHTPFPSSKNFCTLAMRQQILEGVLGADLIRFQASSFVESFEASCRKILGIKAVENIIEFNGGRVALLYESPPNNDVQSWTTKYIDGLLTHLDKPNRSRTTPVLDLKDLRERFKSSTRRLIMFDYDGTLTRIVDDPKLAIPTDRLIRSLELLAKDPRNVVWIISGRDQNFLGEHLGRVSALGLSAEHGCFMRMPISSEWKNLTEDLDMSWKDEIVSVFNVYTEKTPGSRVEYKRVGLTWHYREAEDPKWALKQAQQCHKELHDATVKFDDVHVMAGKANVEVRPHSISKGEVVKKLVNDYGEDEAPDFVLCVGDDFTDEGKLQSLSKYDSLLMSNRYVQKAALIESAPGSGLHGDGRCE